jgi:hypothetical protein
VDIDFPILERSKEVFNMVFISQGGTVLPETGLDFTAFILSQKFSAANE